MTDAELFAFLAVFDRVRRVFPLRGEDHEIRDVGASYFKAMRRFALADVAAGADVWLQRGDRFPKPAQWIDSIPRGRPKVEHRQMTDDEARAYRAAELARYEGPVCGCPACLAAGCTAAQPIRFVPDFDDQDREVKAFDPLLQRVVTTGHWAHGEELKRWYAAKANFYAKFAELCAKKTMKKEEKRKPFRERIDEIFKPKPRTDPPEPA